MRNMFLIIVAMPTLAFGLNLNFVNDILKLKMEPAASCPIRIVYSNMQEHEKLLINADFHSNIK